MDYPKREPYFAMRFLRLLTKSAAAMHLGSDGCLLLMIIVGQEDACRYSRPVSFWNHQLAALLGLRGADEHALRRVRDRCVRAGWLNYFAGNKQLPARYFVTIPAAVISLPDGGSDESPQEYIGNDADIPAQKRQESGENPAGIRQESGKNPAPSSPIPNPTPIPKSAASPPPGHAQGPQRPPPVSIHPEPEMAPRRPDPIPTADWIAWKRSRRIYVARSDEAGNQDEWRDLFRTAGEQVMTEAYDILIRDVPEGKGLGFTACQRWIFTHYQEGPK